ncbi:hypothetical protein [Roseisolibacter agri]|uniref:Terminase n=1 Tax=Roseisolibacter agri TaxID=2014610 RepID=A0AA37V6A5_9BACT|nr:hypothetical protein [Roseisolibacter agri]GLC25076.1 hypothetical protein rosag_15890 [Roseisolibacter agri]
MATLSLWPDDVDAAGAQLSADDVARGGALAALFCEAAAESDLAAARRPLGAPPMSLVDFVRQAWDVLEPDTPYIHNWHVEAVCAHLEAATRSYALVRLAQIEAGEVENDVDDWWRGPAVRDLIINIPPGFMKSLLGAVFWPAWIWTFLPGWRGIFCSYAIDLALRDSVKCRQLIESEWYQQTFKPTWRFAGDQNVKSYFQNTAMGFRLCVSVGGRATGFRGHGIVVDDPLNAADASSEVARTEARTWWDRSMSSRVNDKRTGTRVVIMQRLHEEDLTGHLVERGGYQHLCLPLEFEPERKAATSIGWEDPREEPGECLFPTMFPPEVIAQTQLELLDDYAGQYQQRPTAADGGIFKKGWWKRYDVMPPKFHQVVLACDANVKETKAGSFAVIQLWGRVHADVYLVGQVRARLGFPELIEGLRWASQYCVAPGQRAGAKLIEDKANGPAAIATLTKQIPGIIAVPVEVSKEARWRSASPYVRAGNVYLPDDLLAERWTAVLQEIAEQEDSWLQSKDVKRTWVTDFLGELSAVPNSARDDQADTATMAILEMCQPPQREERRQRPRAGSSAAGAIAAME